MSAKEKSSNSGKRPRANPARSLRLDDLIALKDVKGGRGSVVFGERSDTEPVPEMPPPSVAKAKRPRE